MDCTYWPVLGAFNNWNIMNFTNKGKCLEDFGDIHKGVLDGIGDNIASLLQTGKYGSISTTYSKTLGY